MKSLKIKTYIVFLILELRIIRMQLSDFNMVPYRMWKVLTRSIRPRTLGPWRHLGVRCRDASRIYLRFGISDLKKVAFSILGREARSYVNSEGSGEKLCLLLTRKRENPI